MRILRWILASVCCAAWFAGAQTVSLMAPTNATPLPNTNLPPIAIAPALQVKPLAWDSELKEYTAKPGELTAPFIFNVTNISTNEVYIVGTHTSCGCTVAELPSKPWILAPGSNGQIKVTVNLAGKMGTLVKQISVLMSNYIPQVVNVKITVPSPFLSEQERARNAEMAKADAQAVFKGSCADCHLTPAKGRLGGDLYTMMCGVCHESPRRASMVPNLHAMQKHTDFDFWKDIITNGKTNTLMPAFSIAHGGPLTETQIDSLADFLNKAISRNVPKKPAMLQTATGVPRVPQVKPLPAIRPLQPIKPLQAIQPPQPPTPSSVPPVTMSTNLPAAQ